MGQPPEQTWSSRNDRRGSIAILSAVLAILLSLSLSRPAHGRTLDLSAYRQVIQTALNNLQRDPGEAPQIASDLRSIFQVTLPDGSTVEPDLAAIVSALEARPAQTIDAATGLSSILTQLDRAQAVNARLDRPGNAAASLQDILARSEFHQQSQTDQISITSWVRHELGRLLGPIFAPLGRLIADLLGGFVPPRAVWEIGLAIIGLIAIVLIVLGAIRGIRRGFGPTIARFAALQDSPRLSAFELRNEAESLAGANSYRMAIRTLYLAALIRLEERGALRFERSLTNREVLKTAAASGGPALSDRLAPLVERFDRYWYGADACTEQDYREFARLSDWAWEAP